MSYGGFRRNDNFGPKPVETGKEYDVQITEISRKGDGMAQDTGICNLCEKRKGRPECEDTCDSGREQICHG